LRNWSVRLLVGLIAAGVAVGPGGPAWAACGKPSTVPLTDQPWPLKRLRPDLVWPVSTGKGVLVAVIDSGVSPDHPTLAGKVRPGIDLIGGSGGARCDNVGHGTLIAGLIAGRRVERSSFHGIAPDAEILPVRALVTNERERGREHSVRIATAIRRAVDADADVINLSLTTAPTPELAEAVRYALARNVVLVAAAGNVTTVADGFDGFPAAYEGVIAVASVRMDGGHLASSVVRQYVDIAAPGENIWGPAPQGGGYTPNEGTSFASAYVAGVAALVRAYRPGLSAEEVARRIVRTADRSPEGWNPQLGNGVVNPHWATMSVSAEEEEPAPPAQVGLSAPVPDPLHGVRIMAIWATIAAMAVSALLVSSVTIWRRGRDRRWRPGRPPYPT
jgi:type VII secretion-associated serine protease mycosin